KSYPIANIPEELIPVATDAGAPTYMYEFQYRPS
uniref:Acyl coenzyme A: cholesterol acyltransferase (Fragments) n=1 Tax=Sus scrofa TaxID=9823 RepID=Q9TS80_PIG